MDSNPIGTVFFEDDLNWITRDFAKCKDVDYFYTGWNVCFMNFDGYTMEEVPQKSRDLWEKHGYTFMDRCYIEVDEHGDGHLKIGRSSSKTPHTGTIYLPTGLLSRVEPDAKISVMFSVDVCRHVATDCKYIYVTARTPGVDDDEKMITAEISTIRVFGTYDIQFDNVTRETNFFVSTKVQTDNSSTRVGFDNFKIVKCEK
jgi:hypothetical protein